MDKEASKPRSAVFNLHATFASSKTNEFKKGFCLERKADITMLIATVASSKYPEMEEFDSPFNTVAPSGHIHNHFVLLFHAHECKALALLVTNLRL